MCEKHLKSTRLKRCPPTMESSIVYERSKKLPNASFWIGFAYVFFIESESENPNAHDRCVIIKI